MAGSTTKKKVVAVGAGVGIGAAAGSSIGIAGAFGAISGVLPLAAIGGYLGYKLYKSLESTKSHEHPDGGGEQAQKARMEAFRKRRLELAAKRPPLQPAAHVRDKINKVKT